MLKNVAGQKVQFSLFKSGARIANPTIAATGDFKVSIDGGAQANVAIAPTSDAAGLVTWLPSQAETNGDYVVLLANDADGDEWEPVTIAFETQMATSVEAILVDTAEIGVAGAGLTAVGLADDAITAAKFDESTAFPLKAADAGSTYVARTGADGDTLETLSDEIAAIDCTIAVSAATASTVATGTASISRNYTWEQSFTSTATANLSAATKLWAVGKDKLTTSDDAAEFFIEKTAGLTRLAGAAYTTIANGSITVTGSSGAWSVTCKLEEAVTGSLRELTAAKFAIKALVAGDTVDVWSGNMNIVTGPIVAYS